MVSVGRGWRWNGEREGEVSLERQPQCSGDNGD